MFGSLSNFQYRITRLFRRKNNTNARPGLSRNSTSSTTSRPNSFILRSKSFRGSEKDRKVYLSMPMAHDQLDANGRPKQPFRTNKIETTKYSVLSFIPKNLFEQFRRVANLYFLGMAILQLYPDFGVGNPVFVVLPLLTVILITMGKDGFEDWKRRQADNKFNSTKTHTLANWFNSNYPTPTRLSLLERIKAPFLSLQTLVFGKSSPSLIESASGMYNPSFEPVLWQDVRVGDIIYICKDDPIPADLLILSTSEPDGECYIETKNLDGETNLKPRSSIPETLKFTDPLDLAQLHAIIETGAPTSNLFIMNGSVSVVDQGNSRVSSQYLGNSLINPELDDVSQSNSALDMRLNNLPGPAIPFSIKNVLLRGCVLKNTKFAIGVVLFTGADTKIILNSSPTPSKRSKIEKMMNIQVTASFFILIGLSLVLSIGYGMVCATWRNTAVADLFGIPSNSIFYSAFMNFWSSLILLQNVIPVSLYVSIEFVKSWQAFFIYSDVEMYYEPTDSACIPKSWNLSDDLGQIDYIFSDKTGTLTRNIMEFKKCSINGKVYGKNIPGQETDVEKGLTMRRGKSMRGMSEVKGTEQDRKDLFQSHFQAMKKLFSPKYACLDSEKLTFVDPTLFTDLDNEHGNGEAIKLFFMNLALCHTVLIETESGADRGDLIYRAESPDEKALVAAAKEVGFVFKGKSNTTFHVEMLGKNYIFEQLSIIEFDSTRKRMSVMLQRPAPWNDVILFCKGADNMVLDRVASNQTEIKETTLKHLKEFSNTGLRTLCLAYKTMSRSEFDIWNRQYRAAQSNVADREALVEEACELMEKDLILIGATAIEDKLQEEVPECIEALRRAGIKVWVLTGDKMETAINIGFGCSLLTNDMQVWSVPSGTSRQVQEHFNHIAEQLGDIDNIEGEHAIVIDGAALKHILDNKPTLNKLLKLAPVFKSVICCRTSPLQKAQVVRIMKKGHKALTLSIGDGANDVSMIQEAHVGVAIAGEEGLQASMVSDYTISQFRFLKNLLLVHGQNSYHRISEMILCFFYKNIIWTLASFWYQFFCGFSSNLFFTYTLIPLYNMIFTVAPVIILGTMDQRLTYEYLMKYPRVYKLGIDGKFFSHKLFWIYMADGVYQSLICFFGFYMMFSDVVSSDGQDSSAFEFSSAVAILVIVVANLFVGFHTRYWNWWVHLWVYISILFVFAFIGVYSTFSDEFFMVGLRLYKSAPSFWLSIPLIIVASMLPSYLFFYIKITFKPDDLDIIRERKMLKKKAATNTSPEK